ncbi:MAG: rhombosortase [Planctomycetota bacterium]
MRPWLALLAVAAACAAILVAGEPAKLALRYERDALLDGQLWRALTGHLVHLSWGHLAANVAVGALVVALFRRDLGWAAPLLCALGVTLGLFLFLLRLKWYAGLSGVFYGLVVYGALMASRRRRIWLLAVAAVAAKVIVDLFLGASAAAVEFVGGPIIVEAHLFGAVSGALAFALLCRPGPARRQ